MIALNKLNVTQSGIRDFAQVHQLLRHARKGTTFDKEFITKILPDERHSLILISRFPDEQYYIHDGHHRVFALYLAQRNFLYPTEYAFLDFDSYDKYNEINFKATWVTPLKLTEELRIPNVRDFKNHVLTLPEDEARQYIAAHHDDYAIPREGIFSLEDFSRHVLLKKDDKFQALMKLINA